MGPDETADGTSQPTRYALLKMGVDIGLFEALAKAGDDGLAVAELAEASNADPVLICTASDTRCSMTHG